MRILFYENSAGFSNYTSKLASFLVNMSENEVSYMTNEHNRNMQLIDKKVNLVIGLKEYNVEKKNTVKWAINRIYVSLYNILYRNKFCMENKVDVVSIQSTIPVIDRYFIHRLKRYSKVVYTVHDVIPPIKSRYYSKSSLKKVYKECDHLIVHTEGNKTQLKDLFGVNQKKISVIPHGTDTECPDLDKIECRKRFGIDCSKTVILFYGMIREQKGLDDLLHALHNMSDVQLVIAGNTPYGESFERYQKIIDLYQIDCIRMVRFIPESDVDSLFCAADFVCLPYKYFYSQSGVFMQCIKYRKPVVVSDVSSFKDFLTDCMIGYICKPSDPKDLEVALKKMIETIKKNGEELHSITYHLEIAAQKNSWRNVSMLYMDEFARSLGRN